MECCCPAAPNDPPIRACPVSGRLLARVPRHTVKALLTECALSRYASADYWFCAQPDCSVVYVGDCGNVFTTADVRVPVWHKEAAGRRQLCYCFGDTEETIAREIREHGQSTVADRIRAHVKAERCACDVRNPRGTCCLGDITQAVASFQASLVRNGGAGPGGEP
jgi:hypothetical protein